MRIMENHPYLQNYNPAGGDTNSNSGASSNNNSSANQHSYLNYYAPSNHSNNNSAGSAAAATAYDPLSFYHQQQQAQHGHQYYHQGVGGNNSNNNNNNNNILAAAATHNAFYPAYAMNNDAGGASSHRNAANHNNDAFGSIMAAAVAASNNANNNRSGNGSSGGNSSHSLVESRAALNSLIAGYSGYSNNNNSSANNNSSIANASGGDATSVNHDNSHTANEANNLMQQQQQQQQHNSSHSSDSNNIRGNALLNLMGGDPNQAGFDSFSAMDTVTANGLRDLAGASNFLFDMTNGTNNLFFDANNTHYGTNSHGSDLSGRNNSPLPVNFSDSFLHAQPPTVSSMCKPSYNNIPTTFHTRPDPDEEWLKTIELIVPGLSLEPMSGVEVMKRLRQCTNDVTTRFIPCVGFLVQCQQDLRKGLALANSRWPRKRSNLVAQQFYETYLEHLPQQFFRKNARKMDDQSLQDAFEGIQKLNVDAKACCRQGCEAVKNSFLGGMKEGESWGLRKWLSKNSNGLRICTDLECIKKACQTLDKNAETTIKLAALMRPLAEQALKRLRGDIPPSYQERSAAHPYLPFFHSLEAALRSVSAFDPTDDGIICIDDSDDDEVIVEAVVPPPSKKKTTTAPTPAKRSRKRKPSSSPETAAEEKEEQRLVKKPNVDKIEQDLRKEEAEDSSSGDSDDESVVEVVCIQDVGTEKAIQHNDTQQQRCQGGFNSVTEESHHGESRIALPNKPLLASDMNREVSEVASGAKTRHMSYPNRVEIHEEATKMASVIENVAKVFEQGKEHPTIKAVQAKGFWSGKLFARALRMFAEVMREWDATLFIYREDEFVQQHSDIPYKKIIKHPLGFRDIVSALLVDIYDSSAHPALNNGKLADKTLRNWNMWVGLDFLEAIDLVMLNSLGYRKMIGEGRSETRSNTNKLRKLMWDEIKKTLDMHFENDACLRKKNTPTRRMETSGFVIDKKRS